MVQTNGTYSRCSFIVGEFPSPGLTAGRTDRPLVRPCIVSGRVGEEECSKLEHIYSEKREKQRTRTQPLGFINRDPR